MAQVKTQTEPRKNRTIELHIPSKLGWECVAMDAAASLATLMGFSVDRVNDIKTAVSEAVINAIEHGNALDASRAVSVTLVPAHHTLEISVRDHAGNPLQPAAISAAKPDLEQKLAGLGTARGWGMFLIEELVDEVKFSSTRKGNRVRMIIHLEP